MTEMATVLQDYDCDYCGFVDSSDYFWYYQGKNYCSLHKENKAYVD